MAKAIFNGAVVAESDSCVVVEGNQYFPRDAVKVEFLKGSAHNTVCGWKGTASYYDVVVGSETAGNGAWYYPQPKDDAKNITDHVAFWKGVKVEV